jgi:gas vesicle protein
VPTITSVVPNKRSNKKWWGALIGGLLVSAVAIIPAFLIINGVILLPFTFGGSATLIGVGVGLVIVGAIAGATIGAGTGAVLDRQQTIKKNTEAQMSSRSSMLKGMGCDASAVSYEPCLTEELTAQQSVSNAAFFEDNEIRLKKTAAARPLKLYIKRSPAPEMGL